MLIRTKLLAEGEILADSISGDARLTFDIYEYGQDNTQSVSTYDIVSSWNFIHLH